MIVKKILFALVVCSAVFCFAADDVKLYMGAEDLPNALHVQRSLWHGNLGEENSCNLLCGQARRADHAPCGSRPEKTLYEETPLHVF